MTLLADRRHPNIICCKFGCKLGIGWPFVCKPNSNSAQMCQFPLMASLKLLLHAAGLARLQFCYPSVQAQPRRLTWYSPEWVILAPPHDERACMAPDWNPLGLRKPLPEGGGGGGAGPRHPERTGWKPCGGAAGTTSMCGTGARLWPMKLGRYVV